VARQLHGHVRSGLLLVHRLLSLLAGVAAAQRPAGWVDDAGGGASARRRGEPVTPGTAVRPLWAEGVATGLHAIGSRHVVYVPDNPLSHVLASLDFSYPDVRTTVATREEEAFGIAAGLYLGGARPTVMLQSSGLGNSLNALTSLLLPYKIPVLAIVSMRGDAGEWNDAQVPMGRAVAPICDAIGVPHATPES